MNVMSNKSVELIHQNCAASNLFTNFWHLHCGSQGQKFNFFAEECQDWVFFSMCQNHGNTCCCNNWRQNFGTMDPAPQKLTVDVYGQKISFVG